MAAKPFRNFQQSFRRIIAAIKDHILNTLAQFRLNIIINIELTGIDDRHIKASLDRMIQKYRVHCAAHRFVTAKRERNVGKTAGDMCAGKFFSDPRRRIDKCAPIIIVFFNAGRDRKDIGIKNDILGRKSDFFGKQFISARADAHFILSGFSLPFFVKGHHHCRRTIGKYRPSLFQKLLFAFFHRNRINDSFSLNAFQSGFDHFPFGRVDHDWHTSNVRLGSNQVEKSPHGVNAIKHPLVHIDVDDLRAVFNLLARHFNGVRVASLGDHLAEHRRAGHVGSLANIDEICCLPRHFITPIQTVLDQKAAMRAAVPARSGGERPLRLSRSA